MKIFVLRRGDTEPLGPLTTAEVAEMRIRWQLSDADYYRPDGSKQWKLIGDLVPHGPAHHKSSVLRNIAAVASLALLALLAFALVGRHHAPHPATGTTPPLATALPTNSEPGLSDLPAPDNSPSTTDSAPATLPNPEPEIEANT